MVAVYAHTMRMTAIVLASMGVAHAGANMPISEAVQNGSETIIQVEALETQCDAFSIDEEGSLYSTYRTTVSVQEVLSEGHATGDGQDPIVAGESIEIRWHSTTPGPAADSGLQSCTEPEFSISEGAQRPLVISWTEDAWQVNPWYNDDDPTSIPGSGVLPDCGQDTQEELLDEGIYADPGGGGTTSMGCTVTALPAAGPLLVLGGMLGILRRRTRP